MAELVTETTIIGGGQTGVPLARALAAAGHDVVLIERAHLGGSVSISDARPAKPSSPPLASLRMPEEPPASVSSSRRSRWTLWP